MQLKELKAGNVPIMGWTSQYFSKEINEQEIRLQADALVRTGLADVGYRVVILNEGWAGPKDQLGVITENKALFPNMGRFASELKSSGIILGLSVSADEAKAGIAGPAMKKNLERILLDWGIGLVSIGNIGDEKATREICEAIRSINPFVIIDIRSNGFPGPWIAEVANQWNYYEKLDVDFFELTRNYMDSCLDPNPNSRSELCDRARHSGPGHFYNVGVMPVGTVFDHYREQAIFSEFCLFTCPLLIGADLLKISPETIELLKNKNLIGVNQDEAGVPGVLARYYDPWHSLYKKHLADGSVVFLIVNRCHGNTLTTIEAELDMNLPADTCFEVHDLWEGKSLGVHQGVFDIFVETSDVPTTPCCRMLKVRVLKA